MSTARTHIRNVGRGNGATQMTGAARPVVAEPTPDDFAPVSAETFSTSAEAGGDEQIDPATFDFDPGEHSVSQVKRYVEDNPETVEAVAELEQNGKARSGLLAFLENFNEPEG